MTVAQALHWFDFPRWWPELMRAARPGALFVAWGYAWMECPPRVDEELVTPFGEIIEPF